MPPCGKTLFASAARTATHSSADQTNLGYRGIVITANATAETDTASVTFSLQRKDPASGTYTTILTSAALESVTSLVMRVYPGLNDLIDADAMGQVAIANVANDVLPAVWRLTCTHADADSITYSVGIDLIP